MEQQIKRIAVLTSGGDAPGMNAAIRAVVRTAAKSKMEVIGVQKGFHGLIEGDFISLNKNDVSDIIQRGGTFLYTARCDEFRTLEGQKAGAAQLKSAGIDALIVIGGDGSFEGARRLKELGIRVIGIPVTIDNDVACTDYSIGFDTAVNTAMDAIDKIRDTSSSHERVSIVEVMGRGAGYIALWCGIANGAEDILIPEMFDGNMPALIDRISSHVIETRAKGKTHHIIINAEGIGHTYEIAKAIQNKTGVGTRATILGYLQRGGSPSAKDRMLASLMGAFAVEELAEGRVDEIIAVHEDKIVGYPITEALNMFKDVEPFMYRVSGLMVR